MDDGEGLAKGGVGSEEAEMGLIGGELAVDDVFCRWRSLMRGGWGNWDDCALSSLRYVPLTLLVGPAHHL